MSTCFFIGHRDAPDSIYLIPIYLVDNFLLTMYNSLTEYLSLLGRRRSHEDEESGVACRH